MIPDGALWAGLSGFLTGGICVWLRGWRARGELHRMRIAVEHDCLTGLLNRPGLRLHYQREAEAGRPITLVLLDLDGFKQVNDTYGHEIGDRLLMEVARKLVGACPPTAAVGRLGGDEFLAVLTLPRSEISSTVVAMLACIATTMVPVGDPRASSSARARASAGIAHSPCGDWSTQLKNADIAMYLAKNRQTGAVAYEQGMGYPQPDRPVVADEGALAASDSPRQPGSQRSAITWALEPPHTV